MMDGTKTSGRYGGFAGVIVVIVLLLALGASAGESVAERRARVNEAAVLASESIAVLRQALDDENALIRRAAIRALAVLGDEAKVVLVVALDNGDPVVRRAALMALVGEPTPAAVPYLAKALADGNVTLRQTAIELLAAVKPPSDQIIDLLRQAQTDESAQIQSAAIIALRAQGEATVAFHPPPRDTVLLRHRPDVVDHVNRITVAQSIPLPADGWRFRIDPAGEGHRQKWSEPDYDDAAWSEMSIEKPWMSEYVGVGWYRRDIELPEPPGHICVELVFEGVDESAWVWVNGVYVGGQDIGPDGWNQPFRVEVTQELRWGAVNQITVRVLNTAYAGGIWRPVRLEALSLK